MWISIDAHVNDPIFDSIAIICITRGSTVLQNKCISSAPQRHKQIATTVIIASKTITLDKNREVATRIFFTWLDFAPESVAPSSLFVWELPEVFQI